MPISAGRLGATAHAAQKLLREVKGIVLTHWELPSLASLARERR